MSAPLLWLASLAVAVAASFAGSVTKNPRLEKAMQGATVVAVALFLGATAAGLWEAWSPWELERK